jgi:hypothetical protein
VITAIGIATDPTIAHFCATAGWFGESVDLIDLRQVVEAPWQLSFPPGDSSWVEDTSGGRRTLDPRGSYFCRLIDLGVVSPDQSVMWRTLIAALSGWLEMSPGLVINRPGHVNDNASKPLHETHLARLGFAIPESFTGSRRADLLAFVEAGPTVAKALSGQRADCRVVTCDDLAHYDERSGPVHLQRHVAGDDVRVHVVDEAIVAVAVDSGEDDYRRDARAVFTPRDLPETLCEQLRRATRALGLTLAGWDLRVCAEMAWVLEVNPMPGYSYYDKKLDGRITAALVECFRNASQKETTDGYANGGAYHRARVSPSGGGRPPAPGD